MTKEAWKCSKERLFHLIRGARSFVWYKMYFDSCFTPFTKISYEWFIKM